MHPSTFEYLKPTEDQLQHMAILREAARTYCSVLETLLPDGADKTFVIRAHRSNAMWANVALTRFADGTPRLGPPPKPTVAELEAMLKQDNADTPPISIKPDGSIEVAE